MIIFGYGATYAILLSFIIGKKVVPQSSIYENYNSINFALMGTIILWIFWPIFNVGIYPINIF